MWSVAKAKAELSEILRRARAGEPQVIGAQDPCVVVSAKTYDEAISPHDGRWLADVARRVSGHFLAGSDGGPRDAST